MRFKNPYYKKTKKAFDMMISCGFCKKNIIKYRKIGKGTLLRIWVSRIKEAEFPIISEKLICPFCKKELGNLVKIDSDLAYKTHRSSLRTRRVD